MPNFEHLIFLSTERKLIIFIASLLTVSILASRTQRSALYNLYTDYIVLPVPCEA